MPIKTLADLESQSHPVLTDNGNLRCGVPGSSVTWNVNIILWVAICVAANILHPPLLLMLVLNGGLLFLNISAVESAGRANTPQWLYIIIALQAIVTLQYGAFVFQAYF